MDRRDLLRAAGAAALFTMLPRTAEAAWGTVAARPDRGLTALTPQQAEWVGSFADTWLPRTDTPSATDVGITKWVDVVVAEYYSEAERTQFNDDWGAIHTVVKSGVVPLPAYTPESNAVLFDLLEKRERRGDAASRGYWRMKGLVMHGYFTSERVMKEVLKTEIMPGRYVGDAPHVVRAGR